MDLMNIAIVMDDNYLDYAKVMLHTVFYYHSHRRITIYIFYTCLESETKDSLMGIALKYKQEVEFILIPDQITKNFPQRDPWPKSMWNSVFIPYYLPEKVRRILYLDVDIVVNQKLDNLYDMDMEDCCMIATQDMWVTKYRKGHTYRLRMGGYKYFNFGVNLIDVLQIRKVFPHDICEVEKFCCDNQERLVFLDQDFYNIFCHGKVKYVDSFKYDFVRDNKIPPIYSCKKVADEVKIIHYAGTKPMKLEEIDKYGIIFWKYAKKFNLDKEIYRKIKGNYVQKLGKNDFYKLIFQTIWKNIKKTSVKKNNLQYRKLEQYYYLMNQCLEFMLKGKKISSYMDMHGYKSIALYGVTDVTKRFIDIALAEECKIKYIIDKNQKGNYRGIPYVQEVQIQDNVDVIIIAAEYWKEEIENELMKKTNKDISSISQVIYEVG